MEINELQIGRDELPKLFWDRGLRVGAEIGVYKGEYTEKFLKAGLKMFAIDPWMAFEGQGRTQKVQQRQNFLYGHTRRHLSAYDNVEIIRATSMEALRYFEDESLDFVYIDGDHSFRFIAEDIVEWSKKVKPGGIVAGHDYFTTDPKANNVICHVRPVVDAYVQVFNKELFILGRDEVKNDKAMSWFFTK